MVDRIWKDKVQWNLVAVLYNVLNISYTEKITSNTDWDLQQINHMHVSGGNFVTDNMDDYFQHFSQGMDTFDSRAPYGILLVKKLTVNNTQSIQDRMRVDGHHVPTNAHAVSNQDQEDHLVVTKLAALQTELVVANMFVISTGSTRPRLEGLALTYISVSVWNAP